MLKIISWVLLACAWVVMLAAGDPNQVQPPPDGNGITETNGSSILAEAEFLKTPGPNEPPKTRGQGRFDYRTAIAFAGVLVGLAGLLFGVYQHRQRSSIERQKQTAKNEADQIFEETRLRKKTQTLEDRYKSVLREELGTIQILGSHEITNVPVDLLETFVSLQITAAARSRGGRDVGLEAIRREMERDLTPESALQRAFENHRMLLVLGDAGCGKTTLLKYYAMLCLHKNRYRSLGFRQAPLPVYFPLRDIPFQNASPKLLHDCLSTWATRHYKDIPPEIFLDWLENRSTLILLDGLDEISDLEKRRQVCEWIDDTARSLAKAHLVVTSRWTGYRKLDQIQLGFGHLMAEIRDFSPNQQSQFLRQWFVAAYLKEARDEKTPPAEWQHTQRRRGLNRAQAIIDFLALGQNVGVRELAATPVLLQIIAIIWKEHEDLPQGRPALYEAAVRYLVDYRERRRRLMPPLRATQALRVLAPIALLMQEDLASDTVPRETLHQKMQPIIETMDDKLTALAYCQYLRDRAALLADYGDASYIFRHKSFREYLAALELCKQMAKEPDRLAQLVAHFGDDWWEEPLRFFMAEVDDKLFDRFMDAFFRSDVSRELHQKSYNLLLTMVGEAPQRRTDSLVRCLKDGRLHESKKRYIIDCLKTIGSEAAWEAIKAFSESQPATAAGRFAKGAVAQEFMEPVLVRDAVASIDVFKTLPASFLRPSENNAEYIHIPAGDFNCSVTGETESVPDLYFAKYPVTNRRYRRFISYLAGEQTKLNDILPPDAFARELLAFAGPIAGFAGYLGTDPEAWSRKLRSGYDKEKHFKGDDQPVVGVSCYDAQAYCCWLSSLEAASQELTGARRGRVYRLPTEIEWEWAASGGVRQYPWPLEKGQPTEKLANYHMNVGETTPVGRYPEGATPEGLMDMAGNVFEWTGNQYHEYKRSHSLCGGSWDYDDFYLRCSVRNGSFPDGRGSLIGFRVVCSPP